MNEPFAFLRLSRGLFALVDQQDLAALQAHAWFIALKPRGTAYAAATMVVDGRRKNVKLHLFVWRLMGGCATPIVDHQNGWGLDCRRGNLRPARHDQNAWNTARSRNNTSGHKGVNFDKRHSKWRARIVVDGRRTTLGYFASAEDAAGAYASAAQAARGSFARAA